MALRADPGTGPLMASVCGKTGSRDARVVGEGQGLGAALEPEDTPPRGHSTELLALASPGCLWRTCDDKPLLSGLHSAHLSHLPGVQDELHTAVAFMSAKLHGLGGGLQTQTSPGAGRNRPGRAWARERHSGRWELWRAGNTSPFQRGPHSASEQPHPFTPWECPRGGQDFSFLVKTHKARNLGFCLKSPSF